LENALGSISRYKRLPMSRKIQTPTISKKEFEARLKKRLHENLPTIHMVEKFFMQKRGYIFTMPKPGASVVLLVSGGIDSIVMWGLLMEKYKLKVYPLFLHRGRKRKWKEMKAVKYFTAYFKKRYPDLFIEPMAFSTHLPPPELEKQMDKATYYHPQRLLDHLNIQTGKSYLLSQNGLPYTFPFYGVAYAKYLLDHKNIDIHTVLNAVTAGDGTVVYSQTFTALRATLLSICTITNDYTWQFASIPYESAIGHWFEKADMITLGDKLGLPLEKTWSCYRAGRYQCGNKCVTCIGRRKEFGLAGVVDKTPYECDVLLSARLFKAWKRLTTRYPRLYSIHRFIHNIREEVRI
jgi:7-cyano-7-deazaguanine synthase in queuosine biosynthesis